MGLFKGLLLIISLDQGVNSLIGLHNFVCVHKSLELSIV